MKIIYWGPITPAGKASTGGYEAANRKNIDELRRQGVDVDEYPYPVVPRRFGPLGKLVYVKLFFTPFKWWKYRRRRDVLLHSTPLYGTLTLPALWGAKIASLLGVKVLTDMRAGSLPHYWATKGNGYRRMIRSMLSGSDAVTVEGRPYVDFMRDTVKIGKEAVYFPNLMGCDGMDNSGEGKTPYETEGRVNVLYFGRITGAKGIDVILETRRHLPDNYIIWLAGPIAPDVAPDRLRQQGVEYLGMLTPAQLAVTMKKMQFFIFPTRHVGEGQSNSLIEAMSQGLVPVTSRQGFCCDVVADCGVTLPAEATGADYAAAIMDIAAGDYTRLSAKCRRHIAENHNLSKEITKLKEVYYHICQ